MGLMKLIANGWLALAILATIAVFVVCLVTAGPVFALMVLAAMLMLAL